MRRWPSSRGRPDAERQQLKTAQLAGSQRAALASQGGDVNSGSPLDILGDTARAGATDVATIRSNAARNAYGFRLQGAGAAGQASLASANAANTLANLPLGIGSSLLGGASSLAGKWGDYLRGNPRGWERATRGTLLCRPERSGLTRRWLRHY
jgi:hypothetical protein